MSLTAEKQYWETKKSLQILEKLLNAKAEELRGKAESHEIRRIMNNVYIITRILENDFNDKYNPSQLLISTRIIDTYH